MDYSTGTVGVCFCFCNFSYLTFLILLLVLTILKSLFYLAIAAFVNMKMSFIYIGLVSENSLAFFLSYLIFGKSFHL